MPGACQYRDGHREVESRTILAYVSGSQVDRDAKARHPQSELRGSGPESLPAIARGGRSEPDDSDHRGPPPDRYLDPDVQRLESENRRTVDAVYHSGMVGRGINGPSPSAVRAAARQLNEAIQ
jgi:hypothetical protein